MNRTFIVFLVMYTFAAAMVPRERRAVSEYEKSLQNMQLSSTEKPKKICAHNTPCAWSIYNPDTKLVYMNITNSYCYCGFGTVCVSTEDDHTTAYVFRCREPELEDEDTDSSQSSQLER